MRYNKNLIGLFGFMILLASIMASGITFAQNGYGTSSISLSQANITIVQGGSGSVSYNVNLASGSTWGTTLSVTNLSNLTPAGISIVLSKTYADPSYSGTATILVNSSTAPGKYNIAFIASGDDPSSSPTILALTVTAKATSTTPPSNTIPATTTSPSTATPANVSTTVATPPSSSSGNNTAIIAGIIIVIIIIAVAAAVLVKKK